MSIEVSFTEDPALVLSEAGDFLTDDHARNNVMIVLLNERSRTGDAGRYWIARRNDSVCGVVFQSPLNFSALVSPMEREAVDALVKRIHSDGVKLPGVGFEISTASAFAGEWAARSKCVVSPTRLGRQYECFAVVPPAKQAKGELRLATANDRHLLIDWLTQARGALGGPDSDIAEGVERELARKRMHLWDDGGPVSLAIQSDSIDGFVQIRTVFTPPEQRGKGYATACVAELSSRILASGDRCILYTNLNNPTANHIYQQIGYEVVQETLQLEFE